MERGYRRIVRYYPNNNSILMVQNFVACSLHRRGIYDFRISGRSFMNQNCETTTPELVMVLL